ncbi:unnamed protein product [Clavelina lepadiformis]|uniref:Uncharacterized protein n=1 Tax=Clavelina lepadiformis TaxID=159417 RepID=A0ABP0GX38_CLALP
MAFSSSNQRFHDVEERRSPPPSYESLFPENVQHTYQVPSPVQRQHNRKNAAEENQHQRIFTVHSGRPRLFTQEWVKHILLKQISKHKNHYQRVIKDMNVLRISHVLVTKFFLETIVEKRTILPGTCTQFNEAEHVKINRRNLWDLRIDHYNGFQPSLVRIPCQTSKSRLRRQPRTNCVPTTEFTELKVERERYWDDCYSNTKTFSSEVKKMLPDATGDRVPFSQSLKELRKPAQYHLRRHKEKAVGGKIIYQKQSAFYLHVYHVFCEYDGYDTSFWIVGYENKLYAPYFPTF